MLKTLQAELQKVWTEETYSEEFRNSPAKDKNFRHALLHATKAIGKLVEMSEMSDHDGVNAVTYSIESAEKYLADLIICAVRMASEHPLKTIDIENAVIERLAKKMGLKLESGDHCLQCGKNVKIWGSVLLCDECLVAANKKLQDPKKCVTCGKPFPGEGANWLSSGVSIWCGDPCMPF